MSFILEPSPRKRSGKLKNRTDSEVKNGKYNSVTKSAIRCVSRFHAVSFS